jgi:hypothetical protein
MCITSSNAPVKPMTSSNAPVKTAPVKAAVAAGPNPGSTLPAAGGLGDFLLPDAAADVTAPQRCTLVGEGCKETTPEYGLISHRRPAQLAKLPASG